MDFEDYKAKIQKISSLLKIAKYPEDVLNNKDIDMENDFQDICLNSNANNEIVNEVIARLAQNGNKELVEKNVKNISITTWKEVFNKNNAIKEIFKNNFINIVENNGFITYREISNFVEDRETRELMYKNMETIIRKLCTYDRAALIECIKIKEHGVDSIKDNLDCFFQKGEFDITTTYSKVLVELSSIEELSKIDILIACCKHLKEMLERETAIDNETNVLLNWLYDSMEETQMSVEQRELLQKQIDDAILENFDSILDKANYDKETIKTLKLFSCTYGKFKDNKNLFIEKSNKLIHMTKIYDLSYEKENRLQEVKDIQDASNVEEIDNMEELENKENLEEANNINDEENIENVIEIEEKVEEVQSVNDIEKLESIEEAENISNVEDEENIFDVCEKIEENIENIVEIEEKTEEIQCTNKVEELEFIGKIDEKAGEITNIENAIDCNTEEKSELNPVNNNLDVLSEYAELLKQSGNKDAIKAEDILASLVNSSLYSTDKIIEKVMKRDEKKFEENTVVQSNTEPDIIEEKESLVENNDDINIEDDEVQETNKDSKALIIKDYSRLKFNKILNAAKRIFRKVKKVFSKFSADKIGE